MSEGSRAGSRGGTTGPWNPWDPAKDMTLPPQGSGGLTKAASGRRTTENHTEDTEGGYNLPSCFTVQPESPEQSSAEPCFA